MAAFSPDRYPSNYGAQGWDQGMYQQANPLPRTISSSDMHRVEYCREEVRRDYIRDSPRGGVNFFTTTPSYTLALHSPNPDFKQFVLGRLVDRQVQECLEKDNVLNWCNSATRLIPLVTQPDGNCLLHATSLGMWGFQDRNLTLRRALSAALGYTDNTLYQRWQYTREVENNRIQVQLEPHQWKEEWDDVTKQASPDYQQGKNLDSLDDFHVFLLANILRRPIIMYAATKLRSLRGGGTLQESNFQGVYLPLLWDHTVCKKNPLPLAYSGGHFSALVVDTASPTKDGQFVLPLVDYYGKQLTNKFTLAVEDQTSLVMDYLNPIQIPCKDAVYITADHIICAKLPLLDPPENFKSLVSSFLDACSKGYTRPRGQETVSNSMYGGGPPPPRQNSSGGSGGPQQGATGEKNKCVNDCGRYGDVEHHFMCPQCYQKEKEAHMEKENQLDQPHQADRSRRESSGHVNQFGRNDTSRQGGGGGGGGGGDGSPSMGAVKCPNCAQPGFPQLMGMCRSCYNRSTGPKDREPVYESLPHDPNQQGAQLPPGHDPPPLPYPRNPKERSKCRKPACGFYGTEEFRYYCSRCFENDMENILKEADEPLPSMYTQESFSPTPPESGQLPKQHSVGSTGGNDPLKCPKCREYFGMDEYGGLCHNCFMQSTLPGGAPPPTNPPRDQFAARPSSGGNMRMSTEPHALRRVDERPPYNPTAPQGQYRDHSGLGPISEPSSSRASSRMPNVTAPVATLASEMSDMSVSSNCFVCLGGQVGGASHYSICAKHAADLYKLWPSDRPGSNGREGGGEVRSKPTAATLERDERGGGFQYTKNPSYERSANPPPGPQQYQGREYGGDRRSSGHDSRQYGNGQDRIPPGQRYSNEQELPPRNPPGQRYGNEQELPPRNPPGQRYGNEQELPPRIPPGQQHFGNGPQLPPRTPPAQEPRRYGNEQEPPPHTLPPQEPWNYGNEQEPPPHTLPPQEPWNYGNEQGHPHHPSPHDPQSERYGNEVSYSPQHQQEIKRPPPRPNGGYGDGGYGGQYPYGNGRGGAGLQGGAPRGGGAGSQGGAPRGGGAGSQGGAPRGGGAGPQGATGGGGAEGAAGRSGEFQLEKSLCAEVGCSFKGYRKLLDLCPDCFKEKYPNSTVDIYEFPLV